MPIPERVRRSTYTLYQSLWAGLDWVYPPCCGGCGLPGGRFCRDCQSRIEKIIGPICARCGQPLANAGLCRRCRNTPPSFSCLRSWAIFSGPLRNAIHRLKYRGDIALGEILARPLIEMVEMLRWSVEAVVPVPAGIARKAERGYNQASIIGLPVALACGIPFQPGWLEKIRETPSQVGLTLRQRQENLRSAFKSAAGSAAGKRILIIDDVTTSGATMEACSRALLEGGALETFGLTLARSGQLEPGIP